jgi:hypothetical protein
LMNTTPTGWGQRPENDRLTFVPDAIGADRGDIKDMQTRSSQTERTSGPSDAKVSSDAIRGTRVREIVNRENDRLPQQDSGTTGTVEQTIEGDAIFNSEDLQGRSHESGNVHDADVPSYSTLVGTGTATTEGRLPTYPDAPQGQRWARFEENLRRQRPKIVSHCSVCEELQNRHKEDAA